MAMAYPQTSDKDGQSNEAGKPEEHGQGLDGGHGKPMRQSHHEHGRQCEVKNCQKSPHALENQISRVPKRPTRLAVFDSP